MEWTTEIGEHVTWKWAGSASGGSETDGAQPGDGERYAIRILVDGRRLRGREASEWKARLGEQFPDDPSAVRPERP